MSLFRHQVSQNEEARLNNSPWVGIHNDGWYDKILGKPEDVDLLDEIVTYVLSHKDYKWVNARKLGGDNMKIVFAGSIYTLEWTQVKNVTGFNDALHEAVVGFILNDSKHFARTIACKIYNGMPAGEWVYSNNKDDHIPTFYRLAEYTKGRDFHSIVFNPKTSIDYLKKILFKTFLAYSDVHDEYDFIHGDLHIGNIIITPDEDIVFIDLNNTYIKYNEVEYPTANIRKTGEKGQWYFELTYFIKLLVDIFDQFDLFIRNRDIIRDDIKIVKSRDNRSGFEDKEIKELEELLKDDSLTMKDIPQVNWRFFPYLFIIQDKINDKMSIDEFLDVIELVLGN